MKIVREYVEQFPEGISIRDLAIALGLTQKTLLSFIEAKSDQWGRDPWGKKTEISDMEEAIQIMTLRDETDQLYFRHISYLGYVERYRGAWGPPREDIDPMAQEVEHEFLEFDQYGSFLT